MLKFYLFFESKISMILFSFVFFYSFIWGVGGWEGIIFSSPDPPKGSGELLPSLVVVRRKLFQKSSPLKVLDQWKPNLV
jgi:hypothetical protein